MDFTAQFAPNDQLAQALWSELGGLTTDGAHDISHILRVWNSVQHLMAHEGGDPKVLTAATLLHDCVDVPKNSPQRSQASRLAAEQAAGILARLGWEAQKIEHVTHAIESHSFSANLTPRTIEARILQDADRLDAIGHIGIARCFYISGSLGRAIYDPADPDATGRALDDTAFAIDHFQTKLLRLSGSFQTKTGAELAEKRHRTVQDFLTGLLEEL